MRATKADANALAFKFQSLKTAAFAAVSVARMARSYVFGTGPHIPAFFCQSDNRYGRNSKASGTSPRPSM